MGLDIFGNVAAHEPDFALLHPAIGFVERQRSGRAGSCTSLPTSTMPHSKVSMTSYSWRARRFCAIIRSLSCSRSGASFFFLPDFAVGRLPPWDNCLRNSPSFHRTGPAGKRRAGGRKYRREATDQCVFHRERWWRESARTGVGRDLAGVQIAAARSFRWPGKRAKSSGPRLNWFVGRRNRENRSGRPFRFPVYGPGRRSPLSLPRPAHG